jgi:hypothetical protein
MEKFNYWVRCSGEFSRRLGKKIKVRGMPFFWCKSGSGQTEITEPMTGLMAARAKTLKDAKAMLERDIDAKGAEGFRRAACKYMERVGWEYANETDDWREFPEYA